MTTAPQLVEVARAARAALADRAPTSEAGLGWGALGHAVFEIAYARVVGSPAEGPRAALAAAVGHAERGDWSYAGGRAGAWAVAAEHGLPTSPIEIDAAALDALPCDLFGGVAGVVVGAVAARRAGVAGAQSLVDACGALLVRRARPAGDGTSYWDGPRSGRAPSAALAHGTAGPAYALALAGAHRAFIDAARRYEDRHREAEGWADARLPDGDEAEAIFREAMALAGDLPRAHEPPPSDSFCNGAAGIGLVHLLAPSPSSAALAAFARGVCGRGLLQTPRGLSALAPCHGLGGTVELAIAAQDDALLDACRRTALRAASDWSVERDARTGLFDGLAGAGYTALRLAAPSLVAPVFPGLVRAPLPEPESDEAWAYAMSAALAGGSDPAIAPERTLRLALLSLDLEAPARHLGLRAYGRALANEPAKWSRPHGLAWPLVDHEVLVPARPPLVLPRRAAAALARFRSPTAPEQVVAAEGEALRAVVRAFFLGGLLHPVSHGPLS